MIQFLAPLGLLALFTLVAPIVIHLLSRKPGKTVKVGSLQFLEAMESRQLRSLKLTDVPLLLLRAALLAMLALLLAQPLWKKSNRQTESQTRGWILIAPELINQPHDREFDQRLDSLVTAGNEVHILAPDFAATKTTARKLVNPKTINTNVAPNYWSLLRELDQQLPNGMPLWIFAPNRLAFFRGERPTLQRVTHWFGVPVLYENHDIRSTVSIDSTAALILYDANHEEDARYIQTALETVIEFGGLPIEIQLHFIRGNFAVAKNTKWLFWLAAQPVSKILLQQTESGLCLISDAGAAEYERIDSRIIMADQRLEIFPRLQQRVAAANNGVMLWTDGFGAPLLEGARLGKGWHYRFHSRFHPAWNDLVLSAAFPQWLHTLLSLPETNSDQRRISVAQSRPNIQVAATSQKLSFTTTSLHVPFWLLGAVLFVIERWLAGKQQRS